MLDIFGLFVMALIIVTVGLAIFGTFVVIMIAISIYNDMRDMEKRR